MSSYRLVGVLALSVILAPVALGQAEQRTIKGSIVAIYNLAGRMRVVAGSGDAVGVEITRAGPDAAKLKVETGPIRGRETLRIIYPPDRIVYPDLRSSRTSLRVRDDGTFSDAGGNLEDRVDIRSYGPGLDAHADLVVQIPKGQRVELFVGVGRADVVNVEGNLLLDVASAEVDVGGVRGNLTLDTGSGRVSVRDVTGDLIIDSGSGGLTLDKIKGTTLKLDSGSGGVQGSDIDVKVLQADVGSGGLRMYRLTAADLNIDTGSGGATLEIMSTFEKLIVDAGSGGVTVRAPAALSADVDVETGSGGFQTDFEITTQRVSRNHVQGKIGDGHSQIRIETGSGSVRLLKN